METMKYKLLGKSGLRVSELCLGTMTFGEAWGWGASEDESRKIFEAFVERGGNFIDSANNYTDGTSEQYVGHFVAHERERFVVATKYTLSMRKNDPNGGGNHRKNMIQSLESSLKRLKMEYVDLFYLHMWDNMTPIDEILRGLDDLVRAGKVLYIGVSDTPAWVVSQANTLAELRGWSRFVALQAPYNVAARDVERDLLPMAHTFDMAVATWAPLSGGELTGKYNKAASEPKRYGDQSLSAERLAIVEKLHMVASDIGRPATQVAINWLRHQQDKAQIIPIIGARTEIQMRENLGCLDFALSRDQVQALSDTASFRPGFPHSFLKDDEVLNLIFGDTYHLIENHRC